MSASYCALLAVVSVSLSVYSTHLVLEFFEDWGRDLGAKMDRGKGHYHATPPSSL